MTSPASEGHTPPLQPDQIEALRAATPGLAVTNHLLACGSALMSQSVLDTVTNFLQLEARIGGYEAAASQQDRLDAVYGSVARLVNAAPQEIALVENATAAWSHAFYALDLGPGDRVLTSEAEYGANFVAFLHRQKRDGIVVDVVPSDAHGTLDVDALRAMIDDRVKLIAITWIPTNGGLVNPAEEVGAVAHEHGVAYLLDACQAVGQMPVDVTALNCDFLSATGRKFLRAPRGTGFLYVRNSWLETIEPAMVDHFGADWVTPDRYELRPDARRFETWESAYALRAGFGVAVEEALLLGLEAIQHRSWDLAAGLRDRLREVPGAEVRDIGAERSAIVSFTIEGLDPWPTVETLRGENIAIGATDPSSTWIDSTRRSLPTVMRAAPHYYNVESEIDALIDALNRLRQR